MPEDKKPVVVAPRRPAPPAQPEPRQDAPWAAGVKEAVESAKAVPSTPVIEVPQPITPQEARRASAEELADKRKKVKPEPVAFDELPEHLKEFIVGNQQQDIADRVSNGLGQTVTHHAAKVVTPIQILADVDRIVSEYRTKKPEERKGLVEDLIRENQLTGVLVKHVLEEPRCDMAEMLMQAKRLANFFAEQPAAVRTTELDSLSKTHPTMFVLVSSQLDELLGASYSDDEDNVVSKPQPVGEPIDQWLQIILEGLVGYNDATVAEIRARTSLGGMVRTLLDRAIAAKLVSRRQRGSAGVYSITHDGLKRIGR